MTKHKHGGMEKDKSMDAALSNVLRLGLALAFLTTLCGGILLFWQNASAVVDYQVFTGEPVNLTSIGPIIANAFSGDGMALIQLGILVMIATPISRVLLCVIAFYVKKDYLYVAFSSFVLTILLYSFFFHS